MASLSRQTRRLCGLAQDGLRRSLLTSSARTVCTSTSLQKEVKQEGGVVDESEIKQGWLSKILSVRTIAPSKESHSSQLSNKETLFEVMFHQVKPEFMEDYLNQFQIFQQLMHDKNTGASLVGSFTVDIGDQDEAIHIWEYKGGYPVLNSATQTYRQDKHANSQQPPGDLLLNITKSGRINAVMDFIEFRMNRNKMLRARKNQILLNFSFWPELKPRDGNNLYEMRSYTLKAGTMIEWANNWSRGLAHRGDSNPVCGLFSQIGELYQVHHIWCYPDLQSRKETRENAWQKPGWDEVVQYTVPLIRHMQSRILIPTPFSPLQ